MEAGRKQFDMREEKADDVVEDAVEAFSPLRHEKEIDFEVTVEPDLPVVNVDRHAMVDAIVNLLERAQIRRHAARRTAHTARKAASPSR